MVNTISSSSQASPLASNDTKLIIESNKPIKHFDLDILSIYFENKKQSDGGDLISFNLVDSSNDKLIELVYQDVETKRRVLNKKYFAFGGYLLRASESSYQNESYDLDKKLLIINNIDDLGLESNSDDSVVKIYAEYLLPDNDVVKLTKSKIFKDTYYVEYDQDIDKETLMVKFNKKSKLRNRDIHLLDSFVTHSLILHAKTASTNLSQSIISKLTSLIEKNKYFFDDLSGNYFLIQFENKISKDMESSILEQLNEINEFIIEEVFNFKLANDLKNHQTNSQNFDEKKQVSNSLSKIKTIDLNHYVDKSIQTDLPTLQTNQTKLTSSNAELNNLTKIKPNNIKNDSLVLESDKYYTIGLLNSKQLFINFTDFIKRKYKNIEIIKEKETISIRFNNKDKLIADSDWKSSFLNEINDFFTTKASFVKVQVPKDILSNDVMKNKLVTHLSELNRGCSAVYFKLYSSEGLIYSFGTKNALKKQVDTFPTFFKSIGINSYAGVVNNAGSENGQTRPSSASSTSSFSALSTNTSIQIDSNSLLGLSLLNCKQIFSDFKSNLKNLNSDLVISNGKFFIINIDHQNRDRIVLNMAEFEKNNLKQKDIPIPKSLKREKEMVDLEKHLNRLFSSDKSIKYKIVDQDRIIVYGYAKQLDRLNSEVRSKFANLENNQKDRIKTKLNIKIADKKKYFQSVVLKISNGVYLKELSDLLAKHNAKLEKKNETNGYCVLCTVSDKTKLNNEDFVQNWRTKIDSLLNNFFGRFETVRINAKKNLFDSSGIYSSLVDMFWLDNDNVELIGLKSEIKKLETEILTSVTNSSRSNSTIKINNNSNNNDQKPSKTDTKNEKPSSKSLVNGSNPHSKNETFIIKDLKWYQSRILFEKKYFTYVSDTFKDLTLLLDSELTKMYFTGPATDISLAKKLAFDILGQIIGAQINCSEKEVAKLADHEQDCIDIIKKNNLCCVLDFKSDSDRYTIYGTNMDEMEKCKNLLSEMTF